MKSGINLSTDTHLLKTLERRNRELEVLIEIGKALTSTIELENVLSLIMDQVSRLLKTQAWSMLLRDEENGELTYEIAVSPAAGWLSTAKRWSSPMSVKTSVFLICLTGPRLLLPSRCYACRFAARTMSSV